MRVGIVNEVSACARNKDIVAALKEHDDIEILNMGMEDPQEENPVTYIQTGIMTAIMLNCDMCDMVVGGCGTGQGYLNAVLQFPGVACGLIQEPLDAWLFSQINGGNCISLALNKGYGWAADINLKYIFEKLFKDPVGQGYPLARAESQKNSRECLKNISVQVHKPLLEALKSLDAEVLAPIKGRAAFMTALKAKAVSNELAKEILELLQ